MSVQIEKNTTKTPSPPLGEKERKGPRQTPDDDDVDVERRATMMMNLKKKKSKSRASSTARNRPNANSTTHPSRTPLKVNVSMDSNTTFWCSFSELANFFYL